MSPATLAEVVAFDVAFLVVALALGECALMVLNRWVGTADAEAGDPSLLSGASALLAGLGTAAFIGLALGLVDAFEPVVLAACGVGALVAARSRLARYGRAALQLRLAVPGLGALATAGLLLATAILLAGRYAAALAPPTARDALAYHLPEAMTIADKGEVTLTVGGNTFYGNLPKLVEILFAEGIAFQGVPLAQALHTTVFGAFLLFVFAVGTRLFGPLAGALAAFLIVFHEELAWNAGTGYVDAATVSFEVAAVLAVALWLHVGEDRFAVLAALLASFALSAKYSAAATVGFLGIVILVVVARRGGGARRFVLVAQLAGVVAVIAGYWYVKNLLRYGNPTYPLYFGHRGIDEVRYRSLVAAIQQFGPRTLEEFLRVPTRFANAAMFPATAALYAAPLGALVRRANPAAAMCSAYVVFYSAYWFFLATHQTRFLAPAIVVALVLLAGLVFGPSPRPVKGGLVVAAIAMGLVVIAVDRADDAWRAASTTTRAKLQPDEARYVLGRTTTDEYLAAQFGCQYEAVAFARGLDGAVVDNWSVWHDPSVSFFATTPFTPLEARPGESAAEEARRRGFEHVYIRTGTRERFFASVDGEVVRFRQQRAARERALLRGARLVWTSSDCRIYRISPGIAAAD
jgi:hypothetical protein